MQLLVVTKLNSAELTHDRVLDSTRLIEISITLPTDDWLKLCMQNRDPAKAISGIPEEPFSYFKADITIDGETIPSVGIRKKGFLGSLDNQFPSLKVKFDEYVKQTPIRGLEGLTLNNNKQDSSLLSQFLSYQLFNAAGARAPRCSFVKLTVNGNYLGIYSNVESIGKSFLTRRFGDSSGVLYEGALADFYPKSLDRLDIKSNKIRHDPTKAKQLANAIANPDPSSIQEIEKLVDIDNFMRYWVVESLIGFWDGYTNNQNNFWAYEDPRSGKYFFVPWGADAAFMQAGGFPAFGSKGPISVYANSMLANRLFRDEKMAERYRENLAHVLKEVWREDEITQQIDRLEELLSNDLHFRQKGATRSMKAVRQFVRTRRTAIEKELEKWPLEVAKQPRKPTYLVEFGIAKGSFNTKWSETPRRKKDESDVLTFTLTQNEEDIPLKLTSIGIHRPSQNNVLFPFPAPTPPHAKAEVVLQATRESDGKQITVTIPVDPKQWDSKPGASVAVQGTFNDGQSGPGFFPNFNRRFVAGSLMLSKADFTANGSIEGEFLFVISESRGGLFARP